MGPPATDVERGGEDDMIGGGMDEEGGGGELRLHDGRAGSSTVIVSESERGGDTRSNVGRASETAVSERAEIGVEVWGEIVTNCVREGGRGW